MKKLKVLDLILLVIIIALLFFNKSVILLFFLLLNYIYLIASSALYCKKDTNYCVFRNLCWLLLSIYSLNNINLLNTGNVYKLTVSISVISFVILALMFKQGLKSTLAVILTFAVMNVFYMGCTMITASKSFAYSPITGGIGEITELNMPSRNFIGVDGAFSFEMVADDENLKQTTTIFTNERRYYEYKVGDKVHYTVYSGLWGEKYIAVNN